ncbi:methylenetetrahydrofolate reductase [Colletotrichum scovillei]|uniref:Methylenetetrahydrofolate reductase n=2 Tax=Colletotrichum acutatum species complex TaxID=2707335 RepID=A0A9P7UM07_9PEZI|nr:methylenetetrahydrofolate reductase [Colletotrichum scovillei]KXH28770.1 methylenetetrahydrofolate reductase [Colletotrichum nymphaeae SA-01]KAF4779231.1 methylenetetrahydrofolate reductase [Colletotrichum scovillei]KAG7057791.1 methylenetetrahydrofolate reductase [Colletotrichum scovillei]KAG7076388.1 methylenetetrahydrofolate reductase [Colletotrichum scovillei]KAG7083504.1 methylenetetrahydrofolate reductase [Colletotrichum scovillei]
MEKITDKIAALPADANYFSLEFFPPKTAMGLSNLRDRLDRMERALRPLFVNVTWGAGGSTSTKSLELAEICQRELGLTTCLHLTCTNMSRKLIDKALEDAKALGIRNILALRGDPPRKNEYRDTEDSETDDAEDFVWAVDLVKYIRKNYGDYFCIGVAAYPEGHADESHPQGQSFEHDLPYLVDKVQAGADFIMTQLFFDIKAYENFEKILKEHPSGAFKDIILLPGLMPIQSYQMIKRTTKLSHAKIPDNLMARLDAAKGDDEKVKQVGVDILSELVEQVKEVKSRTPGPKGFHFYTLNLEKAVSFILERTGLIPDPKLEDEEAIIDDGPGIPVPVAVPAVQLNGLSPIPHPATRTLSNGRRPSSMGSDPHNRIIVSGSASNPAYETTTAGLMVSEPVNTRANTLAISEGVGAVGREATWDDFPNGRWGDARSPAYGEIDGYGVSLHMSVTQAMRLWGTPKTVQDINNLFIRHIKGQLAAIPWSEEELLPESNIIQQELLELNTRGWWTVASQPAVNGIPSRDPTFGWGPQHGFVFQKAFVELFIPSSDWAGLVARLNEVKDNTICFYAANGAGDFVSSDASGGLVLEGTEASTNAVTWGVFPGKEIITPTIIEEVSFRAWAEEAFKIWGEWAKVYGKGSESEALLERIGSEYWLVNIIHHDYVERDALWKLLSGEKEN